MKYALPEFLIAVYPIAVAILARKHIPWPRAWLLGWLILSLLPLTLGVVLLVKGN